MNRISTSRAFFLRCLIVFSIIALVGIGLEFIRQQRLDDIADRCGHQTLCIKLYSQHHLNVPTWTPVLLNISVVGALASVIGMKLLNQKKEHFEVKKYVKISAIALAISLLCTGTGLLLCHTYQNSNANFRSCRAFDGYEKCKHLEQYKPFIKVGAPLAKLGVVSVGVATIFLLCSLYTMAITKKNRSV
jgi:hypothetical protein